MSFGLDDEKRHLVPRWRPQGLTTPSPLLLNTTPTKEFQERLAKFKQELEVERSQFEARPSHNAADELIFAYLATGHPLPGGSPSPLQHATPQALKLINSHPEPDDPLQADQIILNSDQMYRGDVQQAISKYRRLLRDHTPHLPLTWLELSRLHTIAGNIDSAERAARTALSLAPHSQTISRSVARFFVHLGDIEFARYCVTNNMHFKANPWLLSAEIAISDMMGRTSRFIAHARRSATSHQNYSNVSELCGALASLELQRGSIKSSKRMFEESLQSPTENAVAQASWAARKAPNLNIRNLAASIDQSHEARAWNKLTSGDLDAALSQAMAWLVEEPFSSKPAVTASYIALVGFSDYRLGQRLCLTGLRSSPRNFILLNNLSVSLALHGDTAAAKRHLQLIDRSRLEEEDRITLTATEGLIAYRDGSPDRGRSLYEKAIKSARNREQKLLAVLYLIQEEVELGAKIPDQLKRSIEEQLRAPHAFAQRQMWSRIVKRSTQDGHIALNSQLPLGIDFIS